MIPYGRQTIEQDDVDAVVAALKSDFLTQGPRVEQFEKELAKFCGAAHAVTFANGTLALLASYHAAEIGPGTAFVTSPLTFAATVNAGLWLGASPSFADVELADGNISLRTFKALPEHSKARALVSVDFGGHPVDYEELAEECRKNKQIFISDACHSLGARYLDKRIGSLADMTVFSFHPVKSITTAEGGAVLTNHDDLAERLRRFRHHGIEKTADYYQITTLGLNGRLSDLQCALGFSQLQKLERFIEARKRLAALYDTKLAGIAELATPPSNPLKESAWHLYWVRLTSPPLVQRRWEIVRELRARGIGAQVHYESLLRHPFYQKTLSGHCPNVDAFSNSVISLPIYPSLSSAEVETVCKTLLNVLRSARTTVPIGSR